MSKNRFVPSLEALESRWCPALAYASDAVGNLSISGTPLGAPISSTLDLTLTADRTIQIVENGAVQYTFFVPGNLTISLQNSHEDVTLNMAGFALAGNVSLNTGSGDDTFTLSNGTIAGSLNVVGPRILDVTDLSVFGTFTFNDGGKALQGQYTLQNVSVGSDFVLTSGENNDNLDLNATTIGRNATLSMRSLANTVNLADTSLVGGQFTFIGGSADDTVSIGGQVVGNAILQLGYAENLNQVQVDGTIGGDLRVYGGLSVDNVFVNPGAVIRNNVYLYLSNSTPGIANVVDFQGTMRGSSFVISGEGGVDDVTLGGSVSGARVTATLGAGNDVFRLNSRVVSLSIDFGFGTDTFIATVPLNFYVSLRNLP